MWQDKLHCQVERFESPANVLTKAPIRVLTIAMYIEVSWSVVFGAKN